MDDIAHTISEIVADRNRIATRRDDLRRLMGRLEVRLRSLVEDLGNPIDPFTGAPLLAVEHVTRPENEHSITFRVARDWVLEFGIHDRDVPLIVNGKRQRVTFGFYSFTNVKDVLATFDNELLERLIGIGEEGDSLVFYEFARPDADNLQSVTFERVIQRFLNGVESLGSLDLLNYNRQPRN